MDDEDAFILNEKSGDHGECYLCIQHIAALPLTNDFLWYSRVLPTSYQKS